MDSQQERDRQLRINRMALGGILCAATSPIAVIAGLQMPRLQLIYWIGGAGVLAIVGVYYVGKALRELRDTRPPRS